RRGRSLIIQSMCFVAGTRVIVGLNENGSYITRNIEDLQEGDLVLARDQYSESDDLDLRPVVWAHAPAGVQGKGLRTKMQDLMLQNARQSELMRRCYGQQ